jgi:hypothetical protein
MTTLPAVTLMMAYKRLMVNPVIPDRLTVLAAGVNV